MGVEGQPSKRQSVKLIFRPADDRHGDIRRTDLLREPEAHSDLVSRLERSLRAHPGSAHRQIVHQAPIPGRPSQPPAWTDRRQGAGEGRVDTDARITSKTIEHGWTRHI